MNKTLESIILITAGIFQLAGCAKTRVVERKRTILPRHYFQEDKIVSAAEIRITPILDYPDNLDEVLIVSEEYSKYLSFQNIYKKQPMST